MSNLAALVDLVEADLKDTANATWSAAEIEQHLRRALNDYSVVNPAHDNDVLAVATNTREISLSALTGLTDVVDVWYPYDESDPQYPAKRPAWDMIDQDTIFLLVTENPTGDATDKMRLFYTKPQTIEDLDAAAATTVPLADEYILVIGATAYAMQQLARQSIGTVTVSGWTPKQLTDWAWARQLDFRAKLQIIRQRMALMRDPRVAWDADV